MARVSRDQLSEMFANISEKSGWDMSGDMVWGYFFTNSTQDSLRRAAERLSQAGYAVVSIYPSAKDSEDEPDMWWLHVERVETHSVDSLDERNQELEAFATANDLGSYDGMDVGPVDDAAG